MSEITLEQLKEFAEHWKNADLGGHIMPSSIMFNHKSAQEIGKQILKLIEDNQKKDIEIKLLENNWLCCYRKR